MKIMDAKDGYVQHMGMYLVINLTLKSAKQPVFESAYYKLKREIVEEFKRHWYVLQSDKMDTDDKNLQAKMQITMGIPVR